MSDHHQLFVELAYRLSRGSIYFVGLLLSLEEIFANMWSGDDFDIMSRICWWLIMTEETFGTETFDMEGLEMV